MSFSKRQFIAEAFGELGLVNYIFDLDPEDLERALRRLDAMMAEWNGRGLRLGYPIPSTPTVSDLDEVSGVPDSANEAIILNLAVRLAPGLGKSTSPDTKIAAKNALNMLMGRAALPPQVQLTGLPAGAGSKSIDAPFLAPATDPLTAGPDSELTFE